MPVLSRFYGIVVKMYYDDHAPPHFHASYGGKEVVVSLSSLEAIRGRLPTRAMKLVAEWSELHREELAANWEHAQSAEPLTPIDPLP